MIEVLAPTKCLRHCLVVDSLVLMLFHSLGSPRGTLDKMCSVMCWPFSYWQGKRPYVSALNWIAILHVLLESPVVKWLQFGRGCPQIEKSVSGPGFPTAGLHLILKLFRSLVNS